MGRVTPVGREGRHLALVYAAPDGEVAVGEAVTAFSERRPVTDRAKLYPLHDVRRRGRVNASDGAVYAT